MFHTDSFSVTPRKHKKLHSIENSKPQNSIPISQRICFKCLEQVNILFPFVVVSFRFTLVQSIKITSNKQIHEVFAVDQSRNLDLALPFHWTIITHHRVGQGCHPICQKRIPKNPSSQCLSYEPTPLKFNNHRTWKWKKSSNGWCHLNPIRDSFQSRGISFKKRWPSSGSMRLTFWTKVQLESSVLGPTPARERWTTGTWLGPTPEKTGKTLDMLVP